MSYAFAFRTGWAGSDIYVARLDKNLQETGHCVKLDLRHPRCNYGREDPRLFIHKGKLHCAFIGVEGRRGIRTNQMFCRLDENFKVEDIFAPTYGPPRDWQKNWSFVDHNDQLYAIYMIKPWTVLKIDSNDATLAYTSNVHLPWSGSHLRGGASPVKVGDEFVSFFHGKHEHPLTYNVGVLCFSATPPFHPTRITPDPILEADPTTNPGNYCPVVFPCGATLVGDTWLVSCGEHDRYSKIHAFRDADIQSQLISVAGL